MTKLMYCPDCKDVRSLNYDYVVKCRCGKCAGVYDFKAPCHATVWGEKVIVLGLANEDLMNAQHVLENPYKVDLIRCWVIRPGVYDWKELTVQRTPVPDTASAVARHERTDELYRDIQRRAEATIQDHRDQLQHDQLCGVYVPHHE